MTSEKHQERLRHQELWAALARDIVKQFQCLLASMPDDADAELSDDLRAEFLAIHGEWSDLMEQTERLIQPFYWLDWVDRCEDLIWNDTKYVFDGETERAAVIAQLDEHDKDALLALWEENQAYQLLERLHDDEAHEDEDQG